MSKIPDTVELYRRQAQSALDKLACLKAAPRIADRWMGETAEYWYGRWSKAHDLAQVNAAKYVQLDQEWYKKHSDVCKERDLARAELTKPPTFKVGDRIKVTGTYDQGRWRGKIGTIDNRDQSVPVYTRVTLLEGRSLLLLPTEMELCPLPTMYLGKTAEEWCVKNQETNDTLRDHDRLYRAMQDRALEAEQKLKELKELLNPAPTTVDYSKPIKFSSIPVTEMKVNLIKEIREATGWGLKMSKMFAEGAHTGNRCYSYDNPTSSDKEWELTATHFARLQNVAEKYGVTLVQA